MKHMGNSTKDSTLVSKEGEVKEWQGVTLTGTGSVTFDVLHHLLFDAP